MDKIRHDVDYNQSDIPSRPLSSCEGAKATFRDSDIICLLSFTYERLRYSLFDWVP